MGDGILLPLPTIFPPRLSLIARGVSGKLVTMHYRLISVIVNNLRTVPKLLVPDAISCLSKRSRGDSGNIGELTVWDQCVVWCAADLCSRPISVFALYRAQYAHLYVCVCVCACARARSRVYVREREIATEKERVGVWVGACVRGCWGWVHVCVCM